MTTETINQAQALMFIKGYMNMHFKLHDTFTASDYELMKAKVFENFGVTL